MKSIANKLVYGFTTKQAQDWICYRLNVLKLGKKIPEKWQGIPRKALSRLPQKDTLSRTSNYYSGVQMGGW